jgi:mono/diheme cytochrome c family protein
MDEQQYKNRAQWLVLIGAGVLLLLLFGAWISEGISKEWRRVQKEYTRILKDQGKPGYEDFERGIFQVDLPDLSRSDRCVSCHHGLEDPGMQQVPQPHATHPGDFLLDHPLQQYGCTICHGGQPGALTRKEAFGQQPETHWPYPLLEQPYIQASCGNCHLAIFAESDSIPMAGMEIFMAGRSIFSEEGCLGCHKARGLGGILGPDLTRQGEKTKHEYSFQNIQGEQSVSNWLKEHFRDPEMVSPGSQMLRIDLGKGDLEALATFVMGLAKPDLPFAYFSLPALNEFKGNRDLMEGRSGFAYLCSACHGKQGEGKSYKDFETGIPSIGNADFLRTASQDYIRFTLEKGRSLRQMASWTREISGLEPSELDAIAGYLMQPGDTPQIRNPGRNPGNSLRGAELYKQYCLTCHGSEGRGGVAVALNQEGLLHFADNAFILTTILKGRGNAGMPGWFILEDQELSDLVAYIGSWRTAQVAGEGLDLPEADLEQGALRYHFLCSRCHGEFGEGDTGPSIINRDFLEAADDLFLYRTIALGRSHTAMFGWSSDLYNQERLERQDISNIISHMRFSAKQELSYVYQGSNPGQHTEGAELFAAHCVECHGPEGEGIKGPALNNQEFLSASSNGYLLATITVGRKGTDMPSWGYGDQEHPKLGGKERQDLVAYIRSLQRIHIKF